MKHKVKKGLIACVLSILILVSVPNIIGVSIPSKLLEENESFKPMSQDGLADKVSISFLGPSLNIFPIPSFYIFGLSHVNKNSIKVNCVIFVNVTKTNDSRIISEMKGGCELQGNTGLSWWSSNWRYFNFIRKGHLFGYFDINVTLIVTNDGSVKTKTAHGIIFLFYFIPWAVIEEDG